MRDHRANDIASPFDLASFARPVEGLFHSKRQPIEPSNRSLQAPAFAVQVVVVTNRQ